MAAEVPVDDPSASLILRAAPDELEKFWHLLSRVPVPVGEIADALGVEIFSTTLDPNISGLIKRTGPGSFEIQINDTDAPVRQRFTACHEIAHYLLHRMHIDAEGITDNILFRSKLSNTQEAEANRFAAALLLPWRTVHDWHLEKFASPLSKANLKAIASAFRASDLAVGFRFGI